MGGNVELLSSVEGPVNAQSGNTITSDTISLTNGAIVIVCTTQAYDTIASDTDWHFLSGGVSGGLSVGTWTDYMTGAITTGAHRMYVSYASVTGTGSGTITTRVSQGRRVGQYVFQVTGVSSVFEVRVESDGSITGDNSINFQSGIPTDPLTFGISWYGDSSSSTSTIGFISWNHYWETLIDSLLQEEGTGGSPLDVIKPTRFSAGWDDNQYYSTNRVNADAGVRFRSSSAQSWCRCFPSSGYVDWQHQVGFRFTGASTPAVPASNPAAFSTPLKWGGYSPILSELPTTDPSWSPLEEYSSGVDAATPIVEPNNQYVYVYSPFDRYNTATSQYLNDEARFDRIKPDGTRDYRWAYRTLTGTAGTSEDEYPHSAVITENYLWLPTDNDQTGEPYGIAWDVAPKQAGEATFERVYTNFPSSPVQYYWGATTYDAHNVDTAVLIYQAVGGTNSVYALHVDYEGNVVKHVQIGDPPWPWSPFTFSSGEGFFTKPKVRTGSWDKDGAFWFTWTCADPRPALSADPADWNLSIVTPVGRYDPVANSLSWHMRFYSYKSWGVAAINDKIIWSINFQNGSDVNRHFVELQWTGSQIQEVGRLAASWDDNLYLTPDVGARPTTGKLLEFKWQNVASNNVSICAMNEDWWMLDYYDANPYPILPYMDSMEALFYVPTQSRTTKLIR